MIHSRPAVILSALRHRRQWEHPIIHTRRYTNLPSWLALPLLCGSAKGKLSCPADLTIVLVHNYQEESILEKSLRYVGIEDFVLLQPEDGQWPSNTLKITELKKYLDSGDCPTERILYIDSDDAVVRGDLGKAVEFFEEEDCDLLFSSTIAKKHLDCLPEAKRWADENARENGWERRYLNAGVFIGNKAFLQEILEEVLKFVTNDDLSYAEHETLHRKKIVREVLPDFPKGCGSDQMIFRYLHPRFYPRMKTDFKCRLALR